MISAHKWKLQPANREMVKCRAISSYEEAHSVFDRLAEWMVQKTGEIKARAQTL